MLIKIIIPIPIAIGTGFVGLLGLEPRLFWTKTRRVASYTMGQFHNEVANLIQSLCCANILLQKNAFPFFKAVIR